MATLLDLCNQALAEIAKGSIASLDEASIEARECKRFAQPLLNEMADWSEELPLGHKRVALAQVTNDRPAEWLYAYAAPSDLGAPLAIRKVEDAAQRLPVAGPFNFPMQDEAPLAYIYEADKIYTNVETATLVYVKSEIEDSDLTPLLQRAFVLELAVRLAGPVAKMSAREIQQKAQQAEVARGRAIADEENKARRVSRRYISEAEYARAGIGV